MRTALPVVPYPTELSYALTAIPGIRTRNAHQHADRRDDHVGRAERAHVSIGARKAPGDAAELTGLRHLLHHLVDHCHGDERPDCPIIDELAGLVQ